VDSGIWFALFDPRDGNYAEALKKAELIENNAVILPWPIMYETLNTRFVKNKVGLQRMQSVIKSPRTFIFDDSVYREAAVDEMLRSALEKVRALSLVDCILRALLSDINVRVDAFLTFNEGDFADVCRARSIPFG
jgi:predicted nucleic acid-binding protein